MAEQPTESMPILTMLQAHRERGNSWVKEPNLKLRPSLFGGKESLNRRTLQSWTVDVRNVLGKIYSTNSQYLAEFPVVPNNLPEAAVHETLTHRVGQLSRIIEELEVLVRNSVAPTRGRRIFIGHGRSPLWRELKDFIADRLGLPYEEFNREPVAGYTTSERLESMIAQTAFAFLIMTAEEEHGDSTVHARPNVIHEVGLFQGRLGLRRAIVVLEDSCSEFSNIIGLSQIRFPRGDISAQFEEVRRVLERERLI